MSTVGQSSSLFAGALGHFRALEALLRLLGRHRELTLAMAKREITDRYAGQTLGWLWAVGHPLVLMGVYVFIFNVVFKVRFAGTAALPRDYTVYLLSGLIPWFAFQEAMNKGATVIVANANLVKQVVFPIEVLPVKSVLATLLTQAIASAVLVVYTLAADGGVPWTYVLLPVLWAAQVLGMIGLCYMLASVGAYFRDVKDVVQVFCTVGMYLMPIFYWPDMVPVAFRPILYLNPFSYMVWCFQDVFYFGRIEHPAAWPVFLIGSLAAFYVGFRVFLKLKVGFGSVL